MSKIGHRMTQDEIELLINKIFFHEYRMTKEKATLYGYRMTQDDEG